jgi:hypothetical protein
MLDIKDTVVPSFGVRVYDAKDLDPMRRGKALKINFTLYSRFGGKDASPSRRVIGTYPAMSLEEARRIAGTWRALIAKGIDPAVVEEAERKKAEHEAALRNRHSFASVAEDFISGKLARERKGRVAERELRTNFVAAWADRPISEITTSDVLAIIRTKQRTAPKMAGALLVSAKWFFNWVIDQHAYGLDRSPCERLKVKTFAGEMQSRTRRLTDAEIFAFWRATGKMGYPVGSVYRTLLLTGLRLNEAAGISWSEIHGDTIVVPASRMKGKDGKAVEHQVGDTGCHRVGAAHRQVRVLSERGQPAGVDDRTDEGNHRPAHVANLTGDGA